MKKTIKPFDLMTKENQEKIVSLNKIAQSCSIQIVNKTNPLLTEGLLKSVEPKNKAQAYFVNKDQTIVELSAKGRDLLLKALVA